MWNLDLSRDAVGPFLMHWEDHMRIGKTSRRIIMKMSCFDMWMGRNDEWDEIIQGDMP